jgi:hypothetical protein
MLMPASDEFVALCQAQVTLLTQTLGAALSIVYLTEELTKSWRCSHADNSAPNPASSQPKRPPTQQP